MANTRNPNVQAALQRIGLPNGDGRVTAGGSKSWNAVFTFAAIAAAAGTIASASVTIESGKFFEADQLNYEFVVTATGCPLFDDALQTTAANTGTPAALVDIRISTQDRAWQSDWMPLTTVAGKANRPAWLAFKGVAGANETIIVEIRNRTGVAINGAVVMPGSLHQL